RAAPRTEPGHPKDTALQVGKCTALSRGTKCQVQANEAVDGATPKAVPRPARESDDSERGERRAVMIPHRQHDLASAQRSLGGSRYRKSVRLEAKHSHIRGGVAARQRTRSDAAPPGGKHGVYV